MAAILFTFGEAFLPDAHLDDARLIHTGDAHIFKYAIINFALPRPLDNDFLSAGYERPKFGRLWLLGRIGAEGEVAAILFTFGEAFLPDAHLDDSRLIHRRRPHI